MGQQPAGIEPLTTEERQILDFEAAWKQYGHTKAEAIRAFGMSPTRYYLALGRILDKPGALFEYPELVRRLLRLRQLRESERHGSRSDRTR